jgi:hypothetical protein
VETATVSVRRETLGGEFVGRVRTLANRRRIAQDVPFVSTRLAPQRHDDARLSGLDPNCASNTGVSSARWALAASGHGHRWTARDLYHGPAHQ